MKPRWIIEGVYGWLVEVVTGRATALIWLDLPWGECRAGLLARGQRRGADDASFAELLTWAEAYWVRRPSSSFEGHARIFEDFPQAKLRLRDRREMAEVLAELASFHA